MKGSFVRLSSLDATDAASHLTQILEAVQPPPQNALLIAEDVRPLVRRLKRRLPRVSWQTLEFNPQTGASSTLPMADREWDAVVAADVMASLPRDKRPQLFRELVRMARRDVLVTAPFGTDLQRLVEKSLADFHRKLLNADHPWLAAHLTFGLPTPDEVFTWVRHGEDADIFYAGEVIAYQRMAEHAIRSASAGTIATLFMQFTKHLGYETGREKLELETVPMRRHRRLYLHLRRA